jgi:hypothetical protein
MPLRCCPVLARPSVGVLAGIDCAMPRKHAPHATHDTHAVQAVHNTRVSLGAPAVHPTGGRSRNGATQMNQAPSRPPVPKVPDDQRLNLKEVAELVDRHPSTVVRRAEKGRLMVRVTAAIATYFPKNMRSESVPVLYESCGRYWAPRVFVEEFVAQHERAVVGAGSAA